jgi:hypothetical protein
MYQAMQLLAKKRLDILRYNSSRLIQSFVRGFIGRRFVGQKIKDLERFYAVIFMQKYIRGKLARLGLSERRRELVMRLRLHNASAVSIQRNYRGFRGRIKNKAQIADYRRKRRVLNDAGTKINTLCRSVLAKKKVKWLKNEQFEAWVISARNWQEIFSEDSNSWFYANSITGKC